MSTLVRVAWLAILLGFGMEILLLILAAGFGSLPGLGAVVADLAGKVSWSTLVCAGLAVGTAVSQARAPLMGVLGFIAAPLAFSFSRALQQGVAKIGFAPKLQATTRRRGLFRTGLLHIVSDPDFWCKAAKILEEVGAGVTIESQALIVPALLKATEYGCLGVAVGWIGGRPWGGALAHAVVGLVVGIVFGGAMVGFTHWTAPEPLATADLFSRGLNEVLFPVDCSLVLYTATALGKRLG